MDRYGLTPKEFAALLAAHDGFCGICRTELNDATNKPVLDHDHTTGAVRGFLCNHCNAGIGWFKENAQSLRDAAVYLEQYSN